jgi:alkanesulfonate monooxygenase SsuD/methylene tetrahydromethanopterin reductase-like flavin-dependent oxidoreductase (luciferase family)
VKVGVHLPLIDFRDEGRWRLRVTETVDAARDCGLAAVSANDHFLFSAPWLDGLTALASVIERSGEMTLATTVSLAGLRGPVPLAKSLAALDLLSEGRLIAGVGPGSSRADHEAIGIDIEDRWKRFEESVVILRALLRGELPQEAEFFSIPQQRPAPHPFRGDAIPIWIGSWGSDAGLGRVARLADGWLASAYNTTPDQFAAASDSLARKLGRQGRETDGFPNALVSMWTWVSESPAEVDHMLRDVLAPRIGRDADELRDKVCVGSAGHCAELLSRYAQAGCQWVQLWPIGDERRQIERIAADLIPRIEHPPTEA